MAGTHRVSGLRGLRRGLARRLGQDDSSINWGQILTTGITVAGQDAAVALKPPTYSSVVNPLTGAQTITSYAPIGQTSSILGTTDLTSSLNSLISSPIVLIGGIALIAVLALKR
jgi:hypothetical protein